MDGRKGGRELEEGKDREGKGGQRRREEERKVKIGKMEEEKE